MSMIFIEFGEFLIKYIIVLSFYRLFRKTSEAFLSRLYYLMRVVILTAGSVWPSILLSDTSVPNKSTSRILVIMGIVIKE
jgi:cytochrome bd-type quinol oxidase subunit 2